MKALNAETALSRNIRLALNRSGRCRLLDNEVGTGASASGSFVRYGLGNGSPDLVGVLRTTPPTLFCIEVKMPGKHLNADQPAWWRSARAWGVLGGVAHSINEAMALLDLAESGVVGGLFE